jgi:CRISPR-associated endonuclease/helicase Cas3
MPEPAIFLHGPQRGEPEVQIIWRADLPKEKPETWLAIVSACQPVVGEALRVPLSQARSWLENKGKEALEGSDLEGESIVEVKPERGETHECRTPFLRWRGVEESEIGESPRDLKPGDTIVVPAKVGGCDEWGWAPATETGDVKDLADIARFKSKRSPVLRLHPSLTAQLPESLCLSMDQSDENKEAVDGLLKKALAGVDLETVAGEAVREALRRLRHDPGLEIEPHPSGQGWIVSGSRRMGASPGDMSSEDDTASSLGREVPLEQHLADVEKVANDFKLGLSKDLTEDIALAARLHDLGKADPRFQALLWKGDRLKAEKAGLLAKSSHVRPSKRLRDIAREKSGYPKGGRHELLSVRLAESCPQFKDQAHDWDLVLHLVASHHGRCRPFAPVVEDPAPRPVTLKVPGQDWECKAQSDNVVAGLGLEHVASGIAERFWRLVRRYGWWGLSYLEACLILADHRASELEEKEARV